MAELGQTDDPRALVPGDPAATRESARQLTAYARDLDEAGNGLRRISTDSGWRGAAADAFRDAFDVQPPKWLDAGDAFGEGSRALDSYAGTLEWAQGQAAEAIRLWKQGEQATASARATYDRQAKQPRPAGAPPLGPFVDPGADLRRQAQELLSRARTQLQGEGDTAADAVGKARDRAPEKPGFWDKVGDTLGDIGDTLLGAGKTAVNDLASFGNAAIHHPGDLAATLGGAGLMVLGAGGEVGGVALDATGVGAVGGVPLNIASAGAIATGAGLAGTGIMNMAQNAAGEDHVEPLDTGEGSSAANEPSVVESPADAPKEISGYTKHGGEQAESRDGGVGVSDDAMSDAVANPVRPVEEQPGGRYVYEGKDATVVLNKDGKVITTWAESKAGWRHP